MSVAEQQQLTGQWFEQTQEAMRAYGGGFVTALLHAYCAADDENRSRIVRAWPEYGAQYAEMGLKMAERAAQVKQ